MYRGSAFAEFHLGKPQTAGRSLPAALENLAFPGAGQSKSGLRRSVKKSHISDDTDFPVSRCLGSGAAHSKKQSLLDHYLGIRKNGAGAASNQALRAGGVPVYMVR